MSAGALGRPRVHYRLTDSTNARARELAARGAPHGALVTADEQSAGRGRQGRSWTAAPGRALLCSILIRDPIRLLPLAAGAAVADVAGPGVAGVAGPGVAGVAGPGVAGVAGPGVAGVAGSGVAGVAGPGVAGVAGPGVAGVAGPGVAGVAGPGVAGVAGSGVAGVAGPGVAGVAGPGVADVAGPPAQIKWPNDVLISGRKVAGILVEGRPQERWAVVGIGLNVALRTDDFPAELRETAGTLGLERDAVEPVLEALLGRLEHWTSVPEGALLDAVRGRDALLGREVRWSEGRGIGAGIDEAGRLLVTTGGETVALDAGEVHLLATG
jgi:BirA family transcriptional regulator, biotin operon repressor / biotin---[acetyl-CoA-carboxylase] ligase